MAQLIQIRRHTAAGWASANPVLSQAELGYETDTGILRAGDGITNFVDLSPISGYKIKDNVISYARRGTLKFVGTGVSVADNPSSDETVITITAGGGGSTGVENAYADLAAMYADQASQTSQSFQLVLNASADANIASGYAYYEYLGTTNGNLTDYRFLSKEELYSITGTSGQPPIRNNYTDIAAMIFDQGNQSDDYMYFVTDASADANVDSGSAYYQYLGTTAGTIADYRLIIRTNHIASQTGYTPADSSDYDTVPNDVKEALDFLASCRQIKDNYATSAALYSDIGSHNTEFIYFVTDASGDSRVSSGYAYYAYLGTTNGTIEQDYRIISKQVYDASETVYLPSTPGDWNTPPTNPAAGLDELAGRVQTQPEVETVSPSDDNKWMNALRGFQQFIYLIANYTVSALNTTSKNLVGAINELFVNKEDSLGNPSVDDYILSSKADGTRSWVENTSSSNLREVTSGTQAESSTLNFSTHIILTMTLAGDLDITSITGIGTVDGGGVGWIQVTHNGHNLTFNSSLVDATNVKTFKDTNGVYYITIQNRGTSLSPDYVIYDPLGDGLIPLNLILTSSDLINASEINYITGGQVWAAPASGKIRHFIGGSFKVNITTPFDSGTLCIGYDINNKLFEYPLADLTTGFWPVLGDVFDGELKWWVEGTPPTTGDGSLVLYAKYSTDFDEI
jgi:hypothetical protein